MAVGRTVRNDLVVVYRETRRTQRGTVRFVALRTWTLAPKDQQTKRSEQSGLADRIADSHQSRNGQS